MTRPRSSDQTRSIFHSRGGGAARQLPGWVAFGLCAAMGHVAAQTPPTIQAHTTTPAAGDAASATTPAPLTPRSRIHIVVVGEPDLTGDYTIDPTGEISMLYVNQVPLGGLSTAQAAQRLASKDYLGKYYRLPQVVVTLVGVGGITVEVDGAVGTQGTRLVRPDAHLNDVMQQAGPAVDADLTKLQVTHGSPGAAHTTDTVDYLSFLSGQATVGNPILADGDVVFVPRKEQAQILVTIKGEVAKPGHDAVAPKTTVYDAIQSAGGLLPDADRSGVLLVRGDTSDQIPIDYEAAFRKQDDTRTNPVLRDGDTLLIKAASISNLYTITGAVRLPGEYPLTGRSYTLAEAIGKAGGTLDRPKLKETTLFRRQPNGKVQAMKLDASDPQIQGNTLLQPGDIIQIPQGSPGTHYDPLQTFGVLGSLYGVLGRR